MEKKKFVSLIKKAMKGEKIAIGKIIEMYEPSITRNSYINGQLDEDCQSEIIMHLVTAIPKFKILE